MYFLFSGEGETDLGECADSAATCEGNDYQHGPMTVIVDQIVESRHHYSPLEVGCCGFVSRGTLVDRASQLKAARKAMRLPGKKRAKETRYFFNNARVRPQTGAGKKREGDQEAKVMTLWESSDKLKLGKSSAFVKKNLRTLRLTDAEFEADFFFDHRFSEKDGDVWIGLVVERELGAVLALEDVRFRPPTVNDLAAILAHAMLRPLTERGRQRPSVVHLRHRPQWQELLPHLQQLGMRVGLAEELPIFDLAAAEWMYKTRMAARFDEALIEWIVNWKTATEVPVPDDFRVTLRKPFPEPRQGVRFRSSDLMHWSHEMCVGAYPSREIPVPHYAPETIVPIRLRADELDAILTKTIIATSEELRPRLEAMAAEGKTIDLNVNEWSCILLALSSLKINDDSDREHLVDIGMDIAAHLAETLGIGPPGDNGEHRATTGKMRKGLPSWREME